MAASDPIVSQPWLPAATAVGSLIYPEGSIDGSRWVQWELAEPYARQTAYSNASAAPFVSQLVCDCGSANVDGCVTTRAATAPYVGWAPRGGQWQFRTPFELPPSMR